ncbi:AAA family ATPase [Streptomyces sp. NPDC059233]
MSVNRVTTRTVPEDADGVRTPLRGRDAELAFIEARLDALDRGEGGIVRVGGPAGIGRSRILAEAAAAARRRGTRVFEGAADPDGQFVPLGPLLDGVLAGTGQPRSGAVRLRDLATTPGQRFWLLQELGDRLRETARKGPLLVVLDDLQWCDDLTLLTFHTLAAGLSSHAILWLVAVRGGSVPSVVRTTLDRIRQAGAHELALGALGDRATTQISEDVLGAAPGPDVLRVARRAEGVPQLLIELIGSLREDQSVTIANGTAGLSDGPPAPRVLPSVVRRLDQLSDEARELVRTAAATGGPVTVAELAELLGRSSAALITAVQESLDADLLAESGDRLAFRQDLIRESVEAGLPLPLRQALRRPSRPSRAGGRTGGMGRNRGAGRRGGGRPAAHRSGGTRGHRSRTRRGPQPQGPGAHHRGRSGAAPDHRRDDPVALADGPGRPGA